jgi:ABC-type multidrug transport system permease subunit
VKTLAITKKFLLEIFREWQLVLMILILPVIFLLITYFMYPGQIIQTHPIQISVLPAATSESNAIVSALEQARYANGLPVYLVHQKSLPENAIIEQIKTHELVLAIELNTRTDPLSITILGDPLISSYYQAINQMDPRWLGNPAMTFIETEITPLYNSGPQTNFELFAPGMIIFAILLLTMQTAMLVTREIKSGTIQRYRLSGTNSFAMIAGITLAQLVIVVLQLGVIGWISLKLGYQIHGSLLLAALNAFILALSAIGQGLLLGCLLENDTQAATLGATAAMIQVFISGAFFEMPSFPILQIGNHIINLFDWIPATSSMRLFTLTLSYNASLADVAYRFIMLLVLTLLTFTAAALVFQRKQLQV